jgi:GABA permease
VRNPLRSEGEAFQFLVVVLAAAIVVIVGALINFWVGVAVAPVAVAFVVWWIVGRRRDEPTPRLAPARVSAEDERRILVIANETVGGGVLRDTIREHAEGVNENVLVVAPALNSPVRHWASDEDGARSAAQDRVDASVARLAQFGIRVRGEIGDGEPLQAMEDAVRTFAPDEIIISTHPPGRSHWLEAGLVEKARDRFALPITHVIGEGGGTPPPE